MEVFGSSAKLRRELDRKGGACRGILECHITGRAYLTHPRAQDLPALAEAGWMRLALDEMESEVSVLAGHVLGVGVDEKARRDGDGGGGGGGRRRRWQWRRRQWQRRRRRR